MWGTVKNFPSIKRLPLADLIPYARNARTHTDAQVAQIAASIREFGWTNPVLVDGERGIIAGHGRVLAARKLGIDEVPCIELAHLTEAQKRAYILADNKLALNAGWENELLALELGELRDDGFDIDLIGFSGDELSDLLQLKSSKEGSGEGGDGSLSGRFMIPPFSVLNAREGWWQDRKRMWLAMGIKSELGRGENRHNAAPGGSVMVSGYDKNGNRLVGLKNTMRAGRTGKATT